MLDDYAERQRLGEALPPLLLVIEVLSPTSARADRVIKRRRYQRAAIPEYWLIDTDSRTIECWRPGDDRLEVLADTIRWQPDGAVEPLVIDIPAYFARFLDR